MTTPKERLLAECAELEERRNKLDVFIDSTAFACLDLTSQSLLGIQATAMDTYWMCLIERIVHWKENTACS